MNEPGAPPPELPMAPPPEPPESAGRQGNPWERRSALGGVQGFTEALKLFVTSPTEAFGQTFRKGDFGSPLMFAIIIGWIGVAIGQIWETLMGASILSMMPAEIRNQIPMVPGTAAGFLLGVVFAPIYIIIGVFIWSAIVHLCLIIVGGLEKSVAGFEGSFRIISYAMVASLANLIPIAGGLIGFVWTLILAVIGIRDLHQTTQGKAVIAVLLPVALCCACIGMLIAIAGAGLMTALATQ